MATTHFVAKAIVLDKTSKFLLLTRSSTHPTLAGNYDLPGGMVEPGEEPGLAVKREINEETGLQISDLEVLYATTMFINGKSYPTLLYVARHPEIEPAVALSWEHDGYEWAFLDKMPEVEPQIAPTYREALAYMREHHILDDIVATS